MMSVFQQLRLVILILQIVFIAVWIFFEVWHVCRKITGNIDLSSHIGMLKALNQQHSKLGLRKSLGSSEVEINLIKCHITGTFSWSPLECSGCTGAALQL